MRLCLPKSKGGLVSPCCLDHKANHAGYLLTAPLRYNPALTLLDRKPTNNKTTTLLWHSLWIEMDLKKLLEQKADVKIAPAGR